MTDMLKSSAKFVKNTLSKYEISPVSLVVIVSCYMALVTNFPFLNKAFTAIVAQHQFELLFVVSVPILLSCLFIIISSIFSISFLLKPVLVTLVMLSSIAFYATHYYGTVFDYSMVQNIVETDSREASSYLNLNAVGFIFCVGVLPCLLIWVWPLKKESFKVSIVKRLSVFVGCVAISTVIGLFYYADYAAVGRNNHDLVQYITPFKLINSSYKYAQKHYFTEQKAFTILDGSPWITHASTDKTVTVLVLGETARAMSFSLNGYPRLTNPLTAQQNVYSFTNVSSCGTATAVSVPCMFSRLSRSDYDNNTAAHQQNVIDVAKKAGVDVLWVDNNNGSCKGVCKRVNTIEIKPSKAFDLCDDEYCLDEVLVRELDNKLSDLRQKHTLIVLHMMGSHGPTYYRRYPKEKRVFEPDCPRSDIQNCNQAELINTYDNTIAYTDFVLNEIILRLKEKALSEGVRASMMYISDHGESLGEKGAFLHGLPYAFAPDEQTHVPWLLWRSSQASIFEDNCTKSKLTVAASHDNLFDTLLGELSISTTTYSQDGDLLASCRVKDVYLLSPNATQREGQNDAL